MIMMILTHPFTWFIITFLIGLVVGTFIVKGLKSALKIYAVLLAASACGWIYFTRTIFHSIKILSLTTAVSVLLLTTLPITLGFLTGILVIAVKGV